MTKLLRHVTRFQMIQNCTKDTMLSGFLKADSFCKHCHCEICFFDREFYSLQSRLIITDFHSDVDWELFLH